MQTPPCGQSASDMAERGAVRPERGAEADVLGAREASDGRRAGNPEARRDSTVRGVARRGAVDACFRRGGDVAGRGVARPAPFDGGSERRRRRSHPHPWAPAGDDPHPAASAQQTHVAATSPAGLGIREG